MQQLNVRLLPPLAILLLLLQILMPSRAWMSSLVLLGGAWLLAYLWARSLARGLRLIREVRFRWVQVGDRLQERFTLVNRGWAPALWVDLIDHSTIPEHLECLTTFVGPRDSVQWQTQSVCTRRGLYSLGPCTLQSGDPLGIYTVSLHDPASADLLVLPPVVPLPVISVAPGGQTGQGTRLRADPLEPTVSAAGLREYRPGDNPRWIHWPSSVRHGRLLVRILESTPASAWWIFLDLEQQAQIGQGEGSTEEHGVILAASLASRGLEDGHAVGLVINGAELSWLPPQAVPEQRLAILRALALARPGAGPLAPVLENGRAALRRGASVIVITPAVEGKWLPALLSLVKAGARPTVLLLDPRSFGGDQDTAPAAALLSNLGIAHHIIPRDLLEQTQVQPGQEGQWEWRVTGLGRATPVRQPGDLAWRKVG